MTAAPVPVGLVTYSVRPRGGVVHTLALGEALHASGYPVRVIALGDPDAAFFRPVSVPFTIIPAPPTLPTLEERVFANVDALAAGLGPLAGDYPILHTQDCISARAACLVRDDPAGPALRVIRTVHHVDDFTSPSLIDCQRQAILEPDLILVVSEIWRKILAEEYGTAAEVVHNGVDAARFASAPPDLAAALRQRAGAASRPLILAVGGIEPRKGSDTLMRAMAVLRRTGGTNRRPVLAVVGGHSFQDYREYRDRVLASIPELGLRLNDDVVLLGTVPDGELPGWYAAADVLAFPSTKEGWGLAVLEAMSAGLPVVASDLPVFREYLRPGHDALMVPVDDADALAGALRSVLGDAPLAARLRAAGREVAQRFSWPAAAAEHRRIYAESGPADRSLLPAHPHAISSWQDRLDERGGRHMDVQRWLGEGLQAVSGWQEGFGPFSRHASLEVSEERFAAVFAEFTGRLQDNYPFFHPSYAGQMLKPPHPAAVAGYLTTMLINPNNHALDGGPATAQMEKEAVAQLASMFGLPAHLGHLTTSGTIANLEALYIARELHPDLGIAFSSEAHYTHGRMCGVLGVPGTAVGAGADGRMDLGELETLLAGGRIGTVVATAGTTSLGAIDPVHEILAIARRHGVRVHVDAAYGGFFALLAGMDGPAGLDPAPWRAIASCDSVVVDPHKHGLQPYGCGAVLFADPEVGRFFVHDSPYTYFTSDELHLGEISLECSRAGAAAAALWLTFALIPPAPEALGQVLAAGRRGALAWAGLLRDSGRLDLYQPPELDIVCYFPGADPALSAIDAASARVLADGMSGAPPVFLSTLRVTAAAFAARHPRVRPDAGGARILRSVLMKPESEDYVPELHARVEALASAVSLPGHPAGSQPSA